MDDFWFAFRHNLGSHCLNDPSLHSKTLNRQKLVFYSHRNHRIGRRMVPRCVERMRQKLGQPEYCEPLAERRTKIPQPVVVSPTPLTSNNDRLYRQLSPKDEFATWDENAWASEETVTDEGGTCHHLP